MGKAIKGIAIICLYCFPFVYFSMYQDFTHHSMLGYILMIVVTVGLAYIAKRYGYIKFVIIGNLISAIVSYFFIGTMAENENWGGFFKPFSPEGMLLLASCLNIIPQLLAMIFTQKKIQEDNQ
ncbi:hypothetical protein R6U77_17645 [Lysinibacillus louembei]|uniref:Uncharacterized protein n=1 Tax=Lysinibacillus louembei TaxID=1470088 RepID=A0ABZ0RWS2_9BACI|nr:hypothetical protein [Lysinibacillus louembei]WPK11692.1 hypothetical protein R6U77_17645 [Lysinibacillus louembei]